jgi:AbrB family looped-hinge helix DNA binding protein
MNSEPETQSEWRFIFPANQFHGDDEAKAISDFLTARLRKPNSFLVDAAGITIISPTKDEGYKAASFVDHENPLQRRLFYTVHGYNKAGERIFDSAAKKGLGNLQAVSVRVDNGGRIVIPKPFRLKLNLVAGDSVVVQLEGDGPERKITLTPQWRAN